MWLYLLLFLIPALTYKLSKNGQNKVFLMVYVAFLAIFVGMSDMFGGYDRYIYGEVFDSIADTTTMGGDYGRAFADFFPSEQGYILLNIVLSWFTANRYVFILIITLLTFTCLYQSLRRYCDNYPYAVVLFLALWFYFSFTYLRQVLGATVVWLGIRYILKRQLWKFLIVWFIAYKLHKSALLFLPLYFIPIKKYSTKTIFGVMLALLFIGISPLPNALFAAYGDMNDMVAKNAQYNASAGFRVEYLLEAVFFLYIIIRNYSLIPNRRTNVLMLNMALIFCGMLLFFIRSDNGGRLSWYYMIGIISTLTCICTQSRRKRILAPMMMVVSLLLYVRVYVAWQTPPLNNLYPYKTFLSNGVRANDYSWENYEYDHMYDVNKLYRMPLRFCVDLNISNIRGKGIQGQERNYGQDREAERH